MKAKLRGIAVIVLLASSLAAAVRVGTTPSAAATPSNAASGSAICTMSKGSMTIAPGLQFGGTATAATFSLTAKLLCAYGSSGVKGGTIAASGTGPSNDCGILANTGVPAMSGTIRWKGNFAPSTIDISNGNFAITGTGISIVLPSSGPSPPVGTTVVTGSFADERLSATLVVDQSVPTFAAGCNNQSSGLTGFTFTGVNGASTLTVGEVPVTPPSTPPTPVPVSVSVDAADPGSSVNQDLVEFNHPVAGSEGALSALGTAWARTDVSFELNEGTSQAAYDCTTGTWDPTYLDGNIAIDRAAGAQPELIVDYFPSCIDFQTAGLSTAVVAADEKKWEALVYQMALHEIGAEHVTTFEVWNEPSFKMTLKNSGSVPGYLTLYKLTAIQLEKAAAKVGTAIEVGGPGVDEFGQIDVSWVTALAAEAVSHNLPLDFVSWHQYPNDPDEGPQSFLPSGICQTGAPLGGQPCWNDPSFDVGLYARGAAATRAALAAFPTLHPFLWVDEWAPDSGNDVRESGPFGAAFVAAALDGAQQSGIDRMSYFDVADPATPSPYGNFGVLFGDLTPKPVYYAFAMWHELAGALLPVNLTPTQAPGPGVPQIGAVASVTPSGTVHVLLYNFDPYDPSGVYGSVDPTAYDDSVTLGLSGLGATGYSVTQELVDGSYTDQTTTGAPLTGPAHTLTLSLAGESVQLITLTPQA